MSITVTFAGKLAEGPELLHTRGEKPFVRCQVMVTNRIRNTEGEWVDGEPTAYKVSVYGTAAINLYDSADRGDREIVHGPMKTETWTDRDTQQKRAKKVVEVSNRFGEVGGSFKFAAACIERQRATTSSATSSAMPSTADEQQSAAEPAAG